MNDSTPFWERLTLDELDDEQWESLCDGCGRCCLQKLEDVDTGEVHFTDIACRMLDCEKSRCRDYVRRFEHVPDCTQVRPLTPQKTQWLPESCAYRLLAEGRPLHAWHPLISGSADSVHDAGISVGRYAIPEDQVPLNLYQQHIIQFDSD